MTAGSSTARSTTSPSLSQGTSRSSPGGPRSRQKLRRSKSKSQVRRPRPLLLRPLPSCLAPPTHLYQQTYSLRSLPVEQRASLLGLRCGHARTTRTSRKGNRHLCTVAAAESNYSTRLLFSSVGLQCCEEGRSQSTGIPTKRVSALYFLAGRYDPVVRFRRRSCATKFASSTSMPAAAHA